MIADVAQDIPRDVTPEDRLTFLAEQRGLTVTRHSFDGGLTVMVRDSIGVKTCFTEYWGDRVSCFEQAVRFVEQRAADQSR